MFKIRDLKKLVVSLLLVLLYLNSFYKVLKIFKIFLGLLRIKKLNNTIQKIDIQFNIFKKYLGKIYPT